MQEVTVLLAFGSTTVGNVAMQKVTMLSASGSQPMATATQKVAALLASRHKDWRHIAPAETAGNGHAEGDCIVGLGIALEVSTPRRTTKSVCEQFTINLAQDVFQLHDSLHSWIHDMGCKSQRHWR